MSGIARKKSQGRIAKKENSKIKKNRLKKSVLALAKASKENDKLGPGKISSDSEQDDEQCSTEENSGSGVRELEAVANSASDKEQDENGLDEHSSEVEKEVEDIEVDSSSDYESENSEQEACVSNIKNKSVE
jgi:hypothetical protein